MGVRAVENLRRETGCDFGDCAGVVFISSSLLPYALARQHLGEERGKRERIGLAMREFARRLGIEPPHVRGANWGCSGYAKGLQIARRTAAAVELKPDQFILLATVNRTSKITDYGQAAAAAVFGDMAQVTLLASVESQKYPVHFRLLYSATASQRADGVFFKYQLRKNVLTPTCDGGRTAEPERVVFALDMMGLGDTAPRAMAEAAAKALRAAGVQPQDVRYVIPHQAGSGMVRLTAIKLDELGIRGEVINGITREIGNVSSSSIPYAIKQAWDRLDGIIACPQAGVGRPGTATVSYGCTILEATEHHRYSLVG